jgi:hypothetical protein
VSVDEMLRVFPSQRRRVAVDRQIDLQAALPLVG